MAASASAASAMPVSRIFFGSKSVFAVEQHQQPQGYESGNDTCQPKPAAARGNAEQHHYRHRAECRSRADAQEFGARHRVLRQPLQYDAGQREHGAGGGGEQHARVAEYEIFRVYGQAQGFVIASDRKRQYRYGDGDKQQKMQEARDVRRGG